MSGWYVVGVGARSGVGASEVVALVREALAAAAPLPEDFRPSAPDPEPGPSAPDPEDSRPSAPEADPGPEPGSRRGSDLGSDPGEPVARAGAPDPDPPRAHATPAGWTSLAMPTTAVGTEHEPRTTHLAPHTTAGGTRTDTDEQPPPKTAGLVLLATVAGKEHEPGIAAAAELLGVPVVGFAAAELARVPVPTPSTAPLAALGTPSIAEAAALLAAGPGGELVLAKRKSARATAAVARRAPDRAPRSDHPQGEEHVHPDGHDLSHHGDAEVGDGLIDLAVNVRAGTPPAWLAERIAASLPGLAAYPDSRAARHAVAARHGRPDGEVLLTAGAAEAFVLLARALRPRHAVVVHPQFTEPEAALLAAGHAVERVLLDPADGFRLDPAAVPADADLVIVGNPTNPTSVLHPAGVLRGLARPGRTLLVDEAFMDAVPGERESLAGAGGVPGLVVLRSLTKTWGLAGLRVGYLLGSPELVAELGRAQPLWAVSSPALAAAEACVAAPALAEAAKAARQVTADRAYLVDRLLELPGVRLGGDAPEAPFVLIRLQDAAGVRSDLREMGYAVRRGDTFPGLGPDWLRVAVRDRRTTDGFTNALSTALTSLPAR